MNEDHEGYVVYYEGDWGKPQGGIFVDRWSTRLWVTLSTMLASSGRTLCIQHVDEKPDWATE